MHHILSFFKQGGLRYMAVFYTSLFQGVFEIFPNILV